jgi:hypothetical protein
MYSDAILDLLATAAKEEADVEKRYETFIGMIHSSTEAAHTRMQGRLPQNNEYKIAGKNLNYSCINKKDRIVEKVLCQYDIRDVTD